MNQKTGPIERVFDIGMPRFFRFLFLLNLQPHMHSLFVWNIIKQSLHLYARYNRYSVIIYAYMFPLIVEKTRVTLWRYPIREPIFHKTIGTCLKGAGHGGYE